jgi:hypothetical protein
MSTTASATSNADQTKVNEPALIFARLLFQHEVTLDPERLEAALRRAFLFVSSQPSHDAAMLQYAFPRYEVRLKEGNVPAQCVLMAPSESVNPADFAEAVAQAWHWREAKEVVKNCTHEVVISDLLGTRLKPLERVELIQKFICAVVSALKPSAIYFPGSVKLIEPVEYVRQCSGTKFLSLYGLLNVRMYELGQGRRLMDGVGLYLLGMYDLEVRFAEVEPTQMADLLYKISAFLFEGGSLRDGDTIQGLSEKTWRCLVRQSALKPARSVVVLVP